MEHQSRTPNFVLNASVMLNRRGDAVELPAGTFIRPLEFQYVPRHITEDRQNLFFDSVHQVYCYTRYGIYPISKSVIRQVS